MTRLPGCADTVQQGGEKMSIYLAQQKEKKMKSLIRAHVTSISLCSQLCKQETQLFLEHSSVLQQMEEKDQAQPLRQESACLKLLGLKNEISLYSKQGQKEDGPHFKASIPPREISVQP